MHKSVIVPGYSSVTINYVYALVKDLPMSRTRACTTRTTSRTAATIVANNETTLCRMSPARMLDSESLGGMDAGEDGKGVEGAPEGTVLDRLEREIVVGNG